MTDFQKGTGTMNPSAPWNVEVLKSSLRRILGFEEATIKRMSQATNCELTVDAKGAKAQKALKAISYGGQTQYLDDDDAEAKAMVKIYIKGNDKNRKVAAEMILGVANGDDVDDHCARAEGALMLKHELLHPDHMAWIRWRLLSVAQEHGVQVLVTKGNVLLSKPDGPITGEAEKHVRVAAETAISEAHHLIEVVVEGKDELEPEDAPEDPAVAALIDQYGLLIKVVDQDDNSLSDFIKVRVVGPEEAAADAAKLLHARFVEGKKTASVLQTLGQVQSMPREKLGDFGTDVKALSAECGVQIQCGRAVIWITGSTADAVAGARETLREMMQFYMPDGFLTLQDQEPAVIESVLSDAAIGLLMSKPDCAVAVEETERTVWICGKHSGEVKQRIDELIRTSAAEQAKDGTEPPAKRRRTSAITNHSTTVGRQKRSKEDKGIKEVSKLDNWGHLPENDSLDDLLGLGASGLVLP